LTAAAGVGCGTGGKALGGSPPWIGVSNKEVAVSGLAPGDNAIGAPPSRMHGRPTRIAAARKISTLHMISRAKASSLSAETVSATLLRIWHSSSIVLKAPPMPKSGVVAPTDTPVAQGLSP
jgi:hypothetical protein